MNGKTIEELRNLADHLAEDGFFVTILITGKGLDTELSASPCRTLGQLQSAESASLH